MPGFVLILHRDGSAVPERVVESLARPLRPAGAHSASAAPAGWPPVAGPGWALLAGTGVGLWSSRGLDLALHGRIDNRREVARELGRDLDDGWRGGNAEGAPEADARLIHAAYRRWGEGCFERLVGPFAVVAVDSAERRVVCGRDALGDRSLIYRLSAGRLLVATHEELLLDHPEVSRDVDEGTVARFFAMAAAAPGRTFFADLRELAPGSGMALSVERLDPASDAGSGPRGGACSGPPRFWRHWSLPEHGSVRYRRDEEYAEHFRDLLGQAVRDRLPDGGTESAIAAVLMSGGLDSTAVAALAAGELSRRGRRLLTVSWVFDELPRADEREFMEPTVDALGAEATWVLGDDAWPLAGCLEAPERHLGVGSPYAAVYRRLRDRSYRAVGGRGASVLLTGECGDQLFLGAESWLRDLLAERRLVTAAREAARGALGAGRDDRIGLRTAVASALRVPHPRRGEPPARRPWLTAEAIDRLGRDGPSGPASWPDCRAARRPAQAASVLDPRIAAAVRQESTRAGAAGIEVRRPYRDRRLIELVLAVPAHQLYRPGWPKWLTRQAMRGLLPETVRRRRRRSSLYPLFRRGIAERERRTVAALLDSPQAWWPRYVRSSWLRGFYPERVMAEVDGAGALVLWQCLTLELWRRRIDASSREDQEDRSRCPIAG